MRCLSGVGRPAGALLCAAVVSVRHPATALSVTGLTAATQYSFLVVSVDANGVSEPNGIVFTVRTAAPAATLTDVINNNAGLVGGI